MGWLFEKTFVVAKINLLFCNFVHENTTFITFYVLATDAATPF